MDLSISRIVFFVIMWHSAISAENQLKKGWVRPNAWESDLQPSSEIENRIQECPSTQECVCPTIKGSDTGDEETSKITFIFYKKLLKQLFDRNTFQNNGESGDQFKRAFSLKFSKNEFDLFDKSSDVRDWDEFVTKVFQNAETIDFENDQIVSNKQTFYNNLLDNIYMNLNSSWSTSQNTKILIGIIVAIIGIFYISIKYDYNIIALGFILIISIGFINAYKKCNYDLAIERAVSTLDNEIGNPCTGFDVKGKEIKMEDPGWFGSFWSKSSKKAECAAYLSNQIDQMEGRDYCLPDVVLNQYIFSVFLTSFESFIFKTIELFQKVTNKLPFPWNFVAAGLFIFTLSTFLTLCFKYIIAKFIDRSLNLKNNQSHTPVVTSTQNLDPSYHEVLRLQSEGISHLARALANSSGVQVLESRNLPIASTQSQLSIEPVAEEPNDEANTEKDICDTNHNDETSSKTESIDSS